jgi:phospholipase C
VATPTCTTGWLKKEKGFEAVNGLTGTETNPMNCSDPKSPLVTISHHADYEPGDMGHEVVDTTEQLTCDRLTDHSKKYTLADMKMNGFITNAHHTSYGPEHQVKFPKQAMEAFPESEVPVIWKLARTSGFADN